MIGTQQKIGEKIEKRKEKKGDKKMKIHLNVYHI